jgi:hypothetical protein
MCGGKQNLPFPFDFFAAPPAPPADFSVGKENGRVLRRAEDERRDASECAPEAHTVRASVPQ